MGETGPPDDVADYYHNGLQWVPMPIAKQCPMCGKQYPKEEYPDGKPTCNNCAPHLDRVSEKAKRRKVLEKQLGRFLASLATGEAKEASFVASVHREYVKEWGGAAAIAHEMKRHLENAEQGSATAINGWLGFLKWSMAVEEQSKDDFDPRTLSTRQLEQLVARVVRSASDDDEPKLLTNDDSTANADQ